jgi:hypothetical protein
MYYAPGDGSLNAAHSNTNGGPLAACQKNNRQ